MSKIRLIDFDQVTLSSLNRHALATLADVGTPKVYCIQRRLEQISPWVHFDCRNELYNKSASYELLGPWNFAGADYGRKPDFVLDCIDNIQSKVDLLHYCYKHSIPVISSMGAGCKSDPTSVVVGDISFSTDDRLSRSTRRRLRTLGVSSGIPVVFSTEKPGPGKAALLPLAEEEFEKGEVGELSVLPDFRARILPVLGTMPAVFGYVVANHVICQISGYPNDYIAGKKGRDKLYDAIHATLQQLHERLAKRELGKDFTGLRIPFSKDDVGYIVDDISRGKSTITGLANRLVLVPWERPAGGFRPDPGWEKEGQKLMPIRLQDLVCMTKEEATRHEREVLVGEKPVEEVYSEEEIQRVKQRMKETEYYEKYQ